MRSTLQKFTSALSVFQHMMRKKKLNSINIILLYQIYPLLKQEDVFQSSWKLSDFKIVWSDIRWQFKSLFGPIKLARYPRNNFRTSGVYEPRMIQVATKSKSSNISKSYIWPQPYTIKCATQQNVQHSFNVPKTCVTVKPRHLCKTNYMNYTHIFLQLLKELLVGCGLTSHSAIFQLYSDGAVVQFSNLDLLPGTQCLGQLGVFSVPSLPRQGHQDVGRRL